MRTNLPILLLLLCVQVIRVSSLEATFTPNTQDNDEPLNLPLSASYRAKLTKLSSVLSGITDESTKSSLLSKFAGELDITVDQLVGVLSKNERDGRVVAESGNAGKALVAFLSSFFTSFFSLLLRTLKAILPSSSSSSSKSLHKKALLSSATLMIGLVVFARVTNNCVPIKIPSLNTHFTLFQPTNGYFNSFLSPGNKNGASCLALDDSASNSKSNSNSATISTKILSATNNNNLFEATNSVMAKRRFGEYFPCSTLSLHKQRNSVNNKLKNENLAFAQKSLLQVSKISTLLRAEDDEVDAESNSYKVSFGTTNGGGTSMFNNKKGRLIITVANSQVTVSSPSQFISEQISQSVAKSINLEVSERSERALRKYSMMRLG